MRDLNLIRSVAWSFHKSTGIEFEELFGEASLAYVEALETHEPEKAKLSTYATVIMQNHLKTFCDEEKRNQGKSSFSDDFFAGKENQEQDFFFQEWVSELPRDLQIVCKVIFEAPEELISTSAKATRGNLIRKLRTWGWSWPRIWTAIREMKLALK